MWFLDSWSYTIRLWLYELFVHSRTVSLRLEDSDALECSFDNYPHTTNLWPSVENCQNYIWSIIVLQLQGDLSHSFFLLFRTVSLLLKNKDTFLNTFPHMVLYVVCGKLLKLHFDALLSSSCRETVLECMNISYNQDLRMQLNQVSHHLLPSPNGKIYFNWPWKRVCFLGYLCARHNYTHNCATPFHLRPWFWSIKAKYWFMWTVILIFMIFMDLVKHMFYVHY